jgi:hypothetical protein
VSHSRFALTIPAFLSGLALCALASMAPAMAQQVQEQELRSRSIARGNTPASTGDAACDAAALAWRACITASPKLAADKAEANTEVDKFIRDVFDARGPHRPSITGACPRMEEGYRRMVTDGTCAANVTGARDDQISRTRDGAEQANR